ncbi:MAG: ABC transporter ATP-binding protein [Gemmatimonadota bacterium]|nr:ABC transporter ATP-binding protein [Gemmatimonadota bacterium]
MSLVALTDVVKTFDGVRAVDGVSFDIDRGEVVGFLGPNGAGKTTTMRLLTQYLEADSGSIVIDGQALGDHPAEFRRRIGYLPETNPLYTDMLAGEYITFMGRLRGMSTDEITRRTDDVVAQTAIEDVYYRPIDELSKGYRQRVGLAQAILSEPEILILDEPTEGLDPNQRVEIRSLITQLGEDRTVLLSTHVMQEVRRTCSRVVIINRGEIVADGEVDELVDASRGGSRVTVELEGRAEDVRGALESLESVRRVNGEESPAGRARFSLIGDGDPRREIYDLAVGRNWPLWELHMERASLEDLFRKLTVERDETATADPTALDPAPIDDNATDEMEGEVEG